MNLFTSSYWLGRRAVMESVRQPWLEVGNLFIPLFFFAVTVGAIGSLRNAFNVENFVAFQMPVAVLQGVAGVAGSAGLGMTQDIQRGYFDKLRVTSAPPFAIVLGRMGADGFRALILTFIVVVVGLFFGTGMEAGVAGAVVIVVLGGLFGLAYSGIGMSIALRTGSPQAAQAGFLLFFPLLFLSESFVPKEFYAGWLEFLATINPVTYVLQGMRELTLDGWAWSAVAKALGSIAGISVLTFALTWVSARWRFRGP
jgi:ABC-2 type transport system permease protein